MLNWLRKWFAPQHEWSLMCGAGPLFFRCQRCLTEYHAHEMVIAHCFISGDVPSDLPCTVRGAVVQ